MDKESLSNYGWLIIILISLSIMIAFAGPFAKEVRGSIANVIDDIFTSGNVKIVAGTYTFVTGVDTSPELEQTFSKRFSCTISGKPLYFGKMSVSGGKIYYYTVDSPDIGVAVYSGSKFVTGHNVVIFSKNALVSKEFYKWFTANTIRKLSPNEFQPLEYIESTDETNYFMTPYIPNGNTVIKLKGERTNGGTWFGLGYNGYSSNFHLTGGDTLNFTARYGTKSSANNVSATPLAEIEFGATLKINGATLQEQTPVALSFNHTMPIFARWNTGSNRIDDYATGKLYYFQIWESGVLLYDYVPCRNSDGWVGLYDRVNNTFLLGSSGFTGGPDSGNVLNNQTKLQAGLYDEKGKLVVTYEKSGLQAGDDYMFPDTSTIGSGQKAMHDYPNAVKIVLPGSLQMIGCEALEGCNKLTNAVIMNGVESISSCAFYACRCIVSITIPKSVNTIDARAFAYCDSLTNITFNGTKAEWNAIEKYDDWDKGTGSYTVHCTDGNISK